MMERVMISIFDMSLTASYVILFVLVLRLLLRRAPKVFSYALWLVVLLRLLCPLSLESAFSLVPISPQAISTEVSYGAAPTVNYNAMTTNALITSAPLAMTGTVNNDFRWRVCAMVWLVGMAVLAMTGLLSLRRLRKRLSGAQRVEGNVYLVKGLETAFVLGIGRPRIYLPQGLGDEERAYILLHEQTHIRRGDHLIKLVAFGALCMHWFNPLVWLSFRLMTCDMEMACDERVLKELGSEIKQAYSASLLQLSAGQQLYHGVPLAFGENDVSGRIKNVLNYKKPVFWLAAVAIAAVIIAAVGLLTNQRSSEQDLSFLNPDNLVAVVAEQTQIQVNSYQEDSYVYPEGIKVAEWIDRIDWQQMKRPPSEEPEITYSLENLYATDVVSEIHLYQAEYTMAAVLYGDEQRYYRIGDHAYNEFERLIMNALASGTYLAGSLEGSQSAQLVLTNLFALLETDSVSSSVPGDYIAANRTVYEEILGYGNATLAYCFRLFEQGGQTALRGQLMALTCREQLGDRDVVGEFATGQDWYDAYKAKALAAVNEQSLPDLEKYHPEALLLWRLIHGESLELMEIILPDYRYEGNDSLVKLLTDTELWQNGQREGFTVTAVEIIDTSEEADRLKIFAAIRAATYQLYGDELYEVGGYAMPVAVTYVRSGDEQYDLLAYEMPKDGSYYLSSIKEFCTTPVSGRVISGLERKITEFDLSTLNDPLLRNVQEHLRKYGCNDVQIVDPYGEKTQLGRLVTEDALS